MNFYYYQPNTYKYNFEKLIIKKNNTVFKELYFNFPYNFQLIRCSDYDFYDIINKIDFSEFCYRLTFFNKGAYMNKELKQVINKDEEVSYSNDDLFNITSWGADLSFRELITMYAENDLIKPSLQRNYVWKPDEASRLIDSILLGLPIPSIFLAKKNEQLLIVDGYQRIRTVYDYVAGIFSQTGKIFKLSNSIIVNEHWRGKAFAELTDDEKRRIRNTTIHAIVFEQKKPNNDTRYVSNFRKNQHFWQNFISSGNTKLHISWRF